MTNPTDLAQQIVTLMESICNQSPPCKAPTPEEKMRAGYEKVKAVKPELTYGEFVAEEERKNCGYFQHLPEALEKGVVFDADFFQDTRRALDMCSKSKFVLIPSKVWSDIIGCDAYMQMFDPITEYDLAIDGRLGFLLGCAYYTDAFASPENKDTSACAGKVVFVIHEEFRPYFNEETKQFNIDDANVSIEAQQAEEGIEKGEAKSQYPRGLTPHFTHLDHGTEFIPANVMDVPAVEEFAQQNGYDVEKLTNFPRGEDLEITTNVAANKDDLTPDGLMGVMVRNGAKQILSDELNRASTQLGVVSYYTPEMLSALASARLRAEQKAKKKLKNRKRK